MNKIPLLTEPKFQDAREVLARPESRPDKPRGTSVKPDDTTREFRRRGILNRMDRRTQILLSNDDLENPKRFAEAIPVILERSGLRRTHERHAWNRRAYALRVGKNPLALFCWLMKNRNRGIPEIDQEAGGRAMKAIRREPAEFDHIGDVIGRFPLAKRLNVAVNKAGIAVATSSRDISSSVG